MSNLSKMTSEAIAKLESDPAILNLRIVIESQYEVWTSKLFPLLQAKKIPCYEFVADLLVKDGHPEATKEMVSNYFCRIREKRKAAAVSSAPVVRSPARRSPVKARSAPSHVVAPAPAPKAPVAVPAVPGVVPVPVTDWLAELLRLEADPGAEWCGRDQWMWDFIEKVAKSYGKNLARDFVSVEANLDPVKVQCLTKLMGKRP